MSTARRVCASLALLAAPATALAQEPERAVPNPTEVALVTGEGEAIYRRFPTGERIYIRDADPPGRSSCDRGCRAAWPPVLAPPGAQPIGDWTIVRRTDGTDQWALKGRPVYSRFHDLDEPPPPGWRLLSGSVAQALPPRR